MSDRWTPAPDALNLGCGEDYHTDAWNVDQIRNVDPDEVLNITETPWPWADNSFTEVRLYHVLEHVEHIPETLRECCRVLEPGGSIEIRWPVGLNERADPDHKHTWVWDTPEMYTGARPWDTDLPLAVEDREVTLHSHLPGHWSRVHTKLLSAALGHFGGGRWAFDVPMTSGEFTVVFQYEQ